MDPSVARITKDDTVIRIGYRAAPGPGQLFMDDFVPTAAPLAVGCLSQERLDQRDSLGPVESRRLLGAFPDHNNPCRLPEINSLARVIPRGDGFGHQAIFKPRVCRQCLHIPGLVGPSAPSMIHQWTWSERQGWRLSTGFRLLTVPSISARSPRPGRPVSRGNTPRRDRISGRLAIGLDLGAIDRTCCTGLWSACPWPS